MRIGVDWGGTKLEVIALDDSGEILLRERIPTPRDYSLAVEAVCDLVQLAETETRRSGTVGLGIPGTISPISALVKNANSTWLNGKPLKQDLEAKLNREVRIQNDANCFAVSEAIDGAGQGCSVVAGIILGTGCGCGIAIDGVAHLGRQGVAGEFGHIPLPWMRSDEFPGNACWCGQTGCLETWISGTGFEQDFERRVPSLGRLTVQEIIALDTEESRATYKNYCDRLARGLSLLINMIDPDIIVLGGGMSNINSLYHDVPPLLENYVFTDHVETLIVPAVLGDSSGVRGAAWLW